MTELEPWKIWAVTGALVAAIFGTTTVRLRLAGGASSGDESVFASVNPPLSHSDSGSAEPNHPLGDNDTYAAAYTAMPIRRSGNSIPAAIADSPHIHSLSVSITEGEGSGMNEPGDAPTTDVGRDLAESEAMPEIIGSYQPFTGESIGESTLVAAQNVDLSDSVQVDFAAPTDRIIYLALNNTPEASTFAVNSTLYPPMVGDEIAMNQPDYYPQSNDVALSQFIGGRLQSDYTLNLNAVRVTGAPNMDPVTFVTAITNGTASDVSNALNEAFGRNDASPGYPQPDAAALQQGVPVNDFGPATPAQQLGYEAETNANYIDARVQANLSRYYTQAVQQEQLAQLVQMHTPMQSGIIWNRNAQTLGDYNENYW